MAGYIGSKSSVTQVDGYSEAEADAEFVNDPNGAITVDGSNVGIGASSPSAKLEVLNTYASDSTEQVRFRDNTGGSLDFYGYANATKAIQALDSSDNDNPKNLMLNPLGGNVGIGTSSPSGKLSIEGNTATSESSHVTFENTAGAKKFAIGGGKSGVTNNGFAVVNVTDNTAPLLITDSGNLFVARTAEGDSNVGHTFRADGFSQTTRSGGLVADFNRLYSHGDILRFQKFGQVCGTIGSHTSTDLAINSQGGTFSIETIGVGRYSFDQEQIYPWNNGQCNLGLSYRRFDVVYAATGSINTSDQTQKQDIESLTATEMLVGKRLSALFKTFRWKDKVVEKGDNARTHTGVMAQDVQAAFTAEGLDATNYALFCSDTWWEHDVDVPAVEAVAEVTDEDGNVTTEAVEAVDAYTRTDQYKTEDEAPEGAISKTLLGIRYSELLSFVAAYNEQRFASIEARLTALEA